MKFFFFLKNKFIHGNIKAPWIPSEDKGYSPKVIALL